MSKTTISPQPTSCRLSFASFRPCSGAEGRAMSHATSSASATMFGYRPSPAHCNEQLKHFGSLSNSSNGSASNIRDIRSLARCRKTSGMGSSREFSLARISLSRSVSGTPSFIASSESNFTMWCSGSSSRPKGLLINQLMVTEIVYSQGFLCSWRYQALALIDRVVSVMGIFRQQPTVLQYRWGGRGTADPPLPPK